jgi:hypothetical protein
MKISPGPRMVAFACVNLREVHSRINEGAIFASVAIRCPQL